MNRSLSPFYVFHMEGVVYGCSKHSSQEKEKIVFFFEVSNFKKLKGRCHEVDYKPAFALAHTLRFNPADAPEC